MAHSDAWDDSYESLPTDDNYGYEIDDYIRKLILAVRERMEVDHVWKVGTDTDGYHNKLTMPVQSSAPAAVDNTGFLYVKDQNSKAELFFRDEDGDEIQLTRGGIIRPILSDEINPDAVNNTHIGDKQVLKEAISATVCGAGLTGGSGVTFSVDGIVEVGASAELKVKVVEIGTWNMDTTGTKNVAHGLTFTNIRSVSAMIRNDDNDTQYIIGTYSGQGYVSASITLDATNAAIYRKTAGVFDNTDFDTMGDDGNRGWVTIWYVV